MRSTSLIVISCFALLPTALAGPPDGRDLYGDPLPEGAVSRLGTLRFRSSGKVEALAIGGAGFLITSSPSGIQRWDASGRCTLYLDGLGVEGGCIAIGPKGALVAGSDSEKGGCVWSAENGARRLELTGAEDLGAVRFTATGEGLVAAAKTIRIWDLKAKRALRTIDPVKAGLIKPSRAGEFRFLALDLAPDGETFAAASSEGHVLVGSLKAGVAPRLIAEIPTDPSTGRWGFIAGRVEALCFTADSQQLYIAHRAAYVETSVRKVDLNGATTQADRDLLGVGAAFTANREEIVTGYQNNIMTYRLADYARRRWMVKHRTNARLVAVSPSGRSVASVCNKGFDIRISDVARGRDVGPVFGHTRVIRAQALSPDGRYLATGGPDPMIRIWDLSRGQAIRYYTRKVTSTQEYVRDLSFTRDTAALVAATGSGAVDLWDLRSPFKSYQPADLRLDVAAGSPATVVAALDLERIFVGCQDGRIQMWSATEKRALAEARVATKRIMALHLLDGERGLLALDDGGGLQLLDLKGLKVKRRYAGARRGPLSANARLVTALSEEGIAAWDIETGARVGAGIPAPSGLMTLAIDPSGDTIAAGTTAREVHVFARREGGFKALPAFGAADDAAAVWLAEASLPKRPAVRASLGRGQPGFTGIACLAWSGDGRALYCASDRGTVLVYEAEALRAEPGAR